MLQSFIKRKALKIKLILWISDSLQTMHISDPEIDYRKANVPDFVWLKERKNWAALERFDGKKY